MSAGEAVVETERLLLRRIVAEDADFIVRLLNEPSFLRYIGDRGVRSADDAREYIRTGPQASYDRHGFGLYLAERKEDGAPIGICGLLRRDALADADLGYALLPPFRSQGYALEAARAVLEHARTTLGLPRVVAVVDPSNGASVRVLEKLGFAREGSVRLTPEGAELGLYGWTAAAG